ncbi:MULTISPECIES: discoidin domain-containing protein [Streptomyces]|nr:MULTISPECIES: discoidin domain-containing protein [Streptomyces]
MPVTAPQPAPPVSGRAAPRRPGDLPPGPAPGPDAWPDGGRESGDGPGRSAPARAAVVCPNCRTENAPDRTLCRRCALLLDPGPAPGGRPPWWRRLLRRRPRRTRAAGARPRRGWRRPRLGLPIVLVLLAVGVWFALPHLSGLFGFARQETGTPESVPPAVCRASSEADGHPASAAVDGFNNRYWAPERAGEGVGEHLECDFAQPVRMMKIVVFSGTSARQDEFLTQSRPARLTVELTSEDGEKTGRTIRLRDQAGQQTFDVRGSGTVSARITVASVYGTGKERRTALAEVEFFGRRE